MSTEATDRSCPMGDCYLAKKYLDRAKEAILIAMLLRDGAVRVHNYETAHRYLQLAMEEVRKAISVEPLLSVACSAAITFEILL